MSNRLTFSLASLVLIFALAFVVPSAMSHPGHTDAHPTVTIAEAPASAYAANAPKARNNFRVKVSFSIGNSTADSRFANNNAELADNEITLTTYNADNGIISGGATASVQARTDQTKQEWIVQVDITNSAVRSFRFQVNGGAVQGNHQLSVQTNEAMSADFTSIPPVLDNKVTLTQEAVSGSQGRYTITVTFKSSTGTALTTDPTPEPTVGDIVVTPSGAAVAINATTGAPLPSTNTLTDGTDDDGIYTVVYQLQYGSTSATLNLIDGYVASSTGVKIPPPVTAEQNPPAAMITVSEHNATARTFRVDVTFTPADDSLGNPGTAIKGKGLEVLKIVDKNDAGAGAAVIEPLALNQQKADNSYKAFLQYSLFADTPLTVTIDQTALKTSNPTHAAGVGGAPTTPPVTGAPGVPTDLTATADQTAKTIALSWTAPTDTGGSPITGYTITQSQTGVADVTATSTTTSHTTGVLTAGTYSFTVAATNANGTGTATAAVTETIDDDPVDDLNQPTDVTVALNDNLTKYVVSWTAPTDKTGIKGYYVQSNPVIYVSGADTTTVIIATKPTSVSVWSTADASDMSPTAPPTSVTPAMADKTALAALPDPDTIAPTVVVGDVADDQGDDFEVRFSITDDRAGFDADGDGIIEVPDDITVTILGPVNSATYRDLTEARPYRVTDSNGNITFASFSMMIKPTRKENRVGIRIQVKATDRAGNEGKHEISVTLGPKDFIPIVTSNPNIISCLNGSTITVTFDRKLAVGEKVEAHEIRLSNPDLTYPDSENKVGWKVVSITDPSFNNSITSPKTTVQFTVMPKSDRSWIGQTRLRVDIAPGVPPGHPLLEVYSQYPEREAKDAAVRDLGANTNAKNEHGVVKIGTVVQLDPDAPFTGIPLRKGTFTIGPVLKIAPGGYIAVAREKENPFVPGQSTLTLSHLGDTTLVVADKNVRAEYADVQGWECMPDLGVLLGIEPYVDTKEKDRGSGTRLAVEGGGGIIVKESPEQRYLNKVKIAKGTVGISEMMWAVDRSKLFGAASNVEQAQEQWIELHNLNTGSVYVTLFDLVRDEAYETYGDLNSDELDRMSNFNSPTGGRWAIRTDGYKKGRDGDSDYGRDFVSMEKVTTPTLAKNYSHADHKPGTSADGWQASQAVYLTRTSRLATVGAFNLPYEQLNYDFIGTPARKNTLVPPAGQVERTKVPSSPVIFNEVANRTNANRYYEWIELRNVTTTEVNLRNYNISYITANGTETTLYEFPNNDNIKIAAEGLLLLVDTDPKNRGDHPVAVDNPNVKYAVTDFSGNGLPDDGEFVLVLRHPEAADKAGTAKAKQGTHERIVDLAGYDPDLAATGTPLHTSLWPLKAFGAPLAHNKIEAETVHYRQHVIDPDKATHGDKKPEHAALRDAGYSGLGYKRIASGIAAHGGTPGYDNGAIIGKIADLSKAKVIISEIMLEKGERGNLPQWIELYNSSKTQAVNTNGWKLHIESSAADLGAGIALNSTITLGQMTIAPNQTILIVSSTTGRVSDSSHFPSSRVVDLWRTSKDVLGTDARTDKVFSSTGLYIKLTDSDDKTVDEIGNLDGNRRTREEPAWEFPMSEADAEGRSSLIRRHEKGGTTKDGTKADGWVLAVDTNFAPVSGDTYYGDPSDYGTPGFRAGGPLPVSLSKFRPERLDDGSIVVRWITESELNNAGFNILRSEKRDGEYTQLNTNLIAGQGTTSERTTYAFPDTSAKPNVVYYYQIQDVSLDGEVNTLRVNRLKGHISAAGKATTTWGEIKALQ